MRKHLVSVIVPIYNTEAYLRRCINSIRAQTHERLEIILVDDGSTDGSGAICDEYGGIDERIRVIHKQNAGPALARNSGIDAARGEWIVFTDSDDFIHECFVEIMLRTAAENSALTARCRFMEVTDDTFTPELTSEEVMLFDWRHGWLFCLTHTHDGHKPYNNCTAIYHKSLFETTRFPALSKSEDIAMTALLLWQASKSPVAISNQVLYYQYPRPISESRANPILTRLYQAKAFDFFIDFMQDKDQHGISDIVRANRFRVMVSAYLDSRLNGAVIASECDYLRERIISDLPWARQNIDDPHSPFALPSSAAKTFKTLQDPDSRFIMYGYGRIGKSIFPWLRHWKVNLVEVWDSAYSKKARVDGVPIGPAHNGQDRDVTVIIALSALRNQYAATLVRADLRDMGYIKMLGANTAIAAVLYGKCAEFLPELLAPL